MPDNDKARVGQAVARVAQGDRAGARAALAEVRNAPADDYGLELALAGDTARAVEVLEPAARGMRGTSRTRQHLAPAYALDGRSAERRVGKGGVSTCRSRRSPHNHKKTTTQAEQRPSQA